MHLYIPLEIDAEHYGFDIAWANFPVIIIQPTLQIRSRLIPQQTRVAMHVSSACCCSPFLDFLIPYGLARDATATAPRHATRNGEHA
jgi:hypothetical protein